MLMLIHGSQKHFQTDLLSLPADIYLLGTGGLIRIYFPVVVVIMNLNIPLKVAT